MPTLQLANGKILTDLDAIHLALHPLPITLKHFDPGAAALFPDLPYRDILSNDEKRQILDLHNGHFGFLRQQQHLWCDLLTLHPGSPNLYTISMSYNRYHIHAGPEAIYALAGEAIYGFIHPNGSHLQLLIQAQDYIHIAAGVEHWFMPAASLHFKAIRYFTTSAGWVPQYTGTPMNDRFFREGQNEF